MSVRVVERVDGWDERPFDGGYDGLTDLADREFSGVVRAGGAELCMTVGTVVGVRQGTIEDFEGATGTAYEAPHPALPLLAIMQEADADVRAQYYTEETPISEVDRTLSDGGFSGFLELSENVLSGDYYVVYHAGESMSVGYVGEAERLITDDEAFQTADDEVGIYKVRQVDVEPIEIPASADGEASAAAATTEQGAEATEAEPADSSADEAEPTEQEATADAEPADRGEPEADTASEPASSAGDEGGGAGGGESAGAADPGQAGGETAAADAAGSTGSTTGAGGSQPASDANTREQGSRTVADHDRQSAAGSGGTQRQARGRSAEPSGAERSGGSQTGGAQRTASAGPAGDLETRAIPSLDPDQTRVPSRDSRSTTGDAGQRPAGAGGAEQRDAGAQPQAGATEGPPAGGAEAAGSEAARGPPSGELDELQAELADREAEIERLEAELADASDERDDLQAELEAVREERDDLASQVERLEEEIERLEQEFGAATDAERRMSPSEAIEGTNLFVDYDSKGKATLEKAHGGSEGREELAENLQLGVHTEFDERAVAVAGQEFGEFLRNTLHYRFARWVIRDLLFEVRDTGHADSLADLYDAIPQIRRVEFNGAVDVEYVEDGQEKAGRERFDVIFRHRMGDPMLVANLNDSREPATGNMMTSLVTAAERVGQSEDSLAAAFLVTSSFFESEALETVSEATQGGLLSRDSRRSFVNLSRKQGYHLCLVAAREGNFHMEVPEL